jgi:hypothetical protein
VALDLCLASRAERQRRFPGDELIAHPIGTVTHAITIDAPPKDVWPWLVQMGAGRAGWYSFDRIDNGGKPSSHRILPGFQHIAAGDLLPAVPGATDAFIVKQALPSRALVLVVPVAPAGETPAARLACSEGPLRASWALILEEVGHGRTRLIGRATCVGRLACCVSRWLRVARQLYLHRACLWSSGQDAEISHVTALPAA